MSLIPKREIESRISRLQSLLGENGVDGALIVQAVDLFYFSGTAQNGCLYLPASGNPVLWVKKSFARARDESALENVFPLSSVKKLPELIASGGRAPLVMGLEMDVLPANTYLFYAKMFSGTELVDISGLIKKVRQIKSGYEMEHLRVSGRKMTEVYDEIPGLIRPGITEVALAAKIEERARKAGHIGYMNMRAFGSAIFFGQLMSGWAAAVPSCFDGVGGGQGLHPVFPQGCSFKTIETGEPIMVDYAGLWGGYITDRSRIYAIDYLSDKLIRAFDVSLKIQDEVIRRVEPGANGSDLFELAFKMADKAGLGDYFMGHGSDRVKFVGHGVGLELDEFPILAKGVDVKLEPGMVFALEPKFVFPGEGLVGIENTFILTEKGVEKVTASPDELVIL
ncbi:M24 family metallopeptidase [Phosphitispora fastidiosa]|uniref:M24 family metallopeptidase n=1 Tax=Phosphitispora fastidiosa TaxID=2837202 RepID=UPI001E478194|nr:Xaa-Pro peptidase family protein [Phosphitispora fastidiosa]MBU7006823.1 Xaa-Pro aminopeptidase [Phosphitispora fastidiosa]